MGWENIGTGLLRRGSARAGCCRHKKITGRKRTRNLVGPCWVQGERRSLDMIADGNGIGRSCEELSPGDQIEAWHNGRLFHRGQVTRIIPSTGLFWIIDAATNRRKLLDSEALEIVTVDP